MFLTKLEITNVRNIQDASFSPSSSINLLLGSNGSGKTSILEAIYLISSGRSFRTHQTKEVIKWNQKDLLIRAQFIDEFNKQRHVGMKKESHTPTVFRLDHQKINKISDLALLMPVNIVHPELNYLIVGGPSGRRKFIDWGMFHVEHSFLNTWKLYRHALMQCNYLYKSNPDKNLIHSWNQELTLHGDELNNFRSSYCLQLQQYLKKKLLCFGIDLEIEVEFKKGWKKGTSLHDALDDSFKKNIIYKTTTVGPHRADLSLTFRGVNVKQSLSRGQQKILVYSLVLSQLELYQSTSNRTGVLLCDDLGAELDSGYREILLNIIQDMNIQAFITANENSELKNQKKIIMFHVEQGKIMT